MVATAVNTEGQREILGVDVDTAETGAGWLAFLRGHLQGDARGWRCAPVNAPWWPHRTADAPTGAFAMREDRRQQGVARTQLEHAENRFAASGCFARGRPWCCSTTSSVTLFGPRSATRRSRRGDGGSSV